MMYLLIVIIWMQLLNVKAPYAPRGTYVEDIDDHSFELLIAGGLIPQRNEFAKHVVSLRTSRHIEYYGDNHFCAGTIISSKVILTAAHCVMDKFKVAIRKNRIRVIAGTPNRLQKPDDRLNMAVAEITTHSNYHRGKKNDIALIRLTVPLPHFMESVKFIKNVHQPVELGTLCTTLGWGQIYPYGPYANELFYLRVQVASHHTCSIELPSYVDHGHICVEDPMKIGDICPGDAGGPLICNGRLAGIAAGTTKCQGGVPMKFTSVHYFQSWIDEMSASSTLHLRTIAMLGLSLLLSFYS